MAEEPDVLIPTEKPRLCPSCGTRVAAMATTCLMCGASLSEEEIEPEQEEVRRKLPTWARPLIVIALALAILAAGFYGLYALMSAEPQEERPTPTPTLTPTVTPTPTPTLTPSPTFTPSPLPPLTYQVEQGDTLSAIAEIYDTAVEDILALNPGVDPDNLQVGYVLLIPAGTLTPTVTPTLDPNIPTPTPGNFIVHVVVRGETLSSIAQEYDVSIALIREVNNLSVSDDTIFEGQSLIIPLGTPMPSPTSTVDPNATPTPIPPYAPPALLSPPNGATLAGTEAPVLLQWASVSVLREDEWYAVTLFQPPGDVISSTIHTRTTAWRVPFDLLLGADGDEAEFHWQVQVVREARGEDGTLIYEEAGLPSEVRTFTWLAPTPTPTPTPTPVP